MHLGTILHIQWHLASSSFLFSFILLSYALFIVYICFAVNSKVDMRFNVKDAQWLSDRVRERIMQVVGLDHF